MGRALARGDAANAIAAGLCLARLAPAREALGRAGPWVLATMSERLDLPPLGVVADLGALLFGASLAPLHRSAVLPTDDPALLGAVRRYEDAVLGRLATDGRFAAAGLAVLRLPRELHAQAVGVLVAGVLARVDYDVGVEVPPGLVRDLTERAPDAALRRGLSAIRDDVAVRKWLTEGYAALARGAQKARQLLGDADLFALENLAVLGSLTQRLAALDVARAEEAIAGTIPRHVPRRRKHEGSVATRLEDESAYPTGGFASVSTSGSLENLLTSELIYMDRAGLRGQSDVDLFDLRYVEGELLYYARDEAIFVRRRRLVVLALAPDLVRARVKDRELPWQRIVLVLGLVLVITKKLAELLGEEALQICVLFLHEDGQRSPLADEMALAALMLREWRDKGIADVEEASWAELAALAAGAAKRGLACVVRIGSTPSVGPAGRDPRILVVDLVTPTGTLEAWSRATADLLSALL